MSWVDSERLLLIALNPGSSDITGIKVRAVHSLVLRPLLARARVGRCVMANLPSILKPVQVL